MTFKDRKNLSKIIEQQLTLELGRDLEGKTRGDRHVLHLNLGGDDKSVFFICNKQYELYT